MQQPRYHPAPGDLVRVRRQRWRVLHAHADGAFVLLSLAGAGPANAGTVQPFIAPFDLVEAASPVVRPRRVPARVWRPVVRDLIASTAPAGSLRLLARAHVDLLPHQLEPALAIVRGGCTRVLLADDVGLGKTVEAGLIVAELRARACAQRVLVLTPAGLRDQWQTELRDRFGIDATIADAPALAASSTTFVVNPWQTCDVAIASVDLVKRAEHLAGILECSWDLLIVDEAHNTAEGTDRRAAVEAVARRTPYVVLVTATPHNGDRVAFASLCGIGGQHDACAVFRHARADVRLEGRRRAHLLRVAPAAAERRMHAALATFTRAVMREHAETADRAWLAVSVLNKRALSSAHALWRSATRRIESLGERDGSEIAPLLPFDDPDGELDARDDEPAWVGGPVLADAAREERLLTAVARTAAEAAREGESKVRAIGRWIRRAAEPVIVFSEYRDTLRHVADAIGRPSVQLHGGLSRSERRDVLAQFPARVPILLATDAAGEGLNLHEHCRTVINLELPWNPVRLEQRIGRVDRIGQSRTVHALVLVARGTPEEQILERLRVRIMRARRDITGADPLGHDTERDIERLVLIGDGDGDNDASPAETLAGLTWPALEKEAAAEVDRVRWARTIAVADRDDASAVECGIARTKHRDTRFRLGASTLALIELIVEDGRGALVERVLVPLSIECGIAVDPAGGCGDLIEMLKGCDAVVDRRLEAVSVARAFAAARAERERAIAASAFDTMTAPLQPGLFDRRAERALAAARVVAEAARDALARRASIAEQAAAGCAARVVLRVIVQATR